MMELLRLYGQIALLRKGPQDVPASPLVLFVTVVSFFGAICLVSLLLPPVPGPWVLHLVVHVLFMLAWYAVLLRTQNKSERFLQTTTALFGYQFLLSPPIIVLSGLMRVFENETFLLVPVVILSLILGIWAIAAGARILSAALEFSMPASVSLIIAQELAALLLFGVLFGSQV